MQELKPYTTLAPIKKALDNGGRFYNFFDKAENEEVSKGELAKAAGVFTAGMQAFTFLSMSQQDLKAADQEAVLSLLEPSLRKSYQKKKPPFVKPSEIESGYKAGQSVIASGYLKPIEDRTQFTGMIMIPVMVGKIVTMIPIPIFEHFKVFECFDAAALKGASAIVAIAKNKKFDASGLLQFGGVLKKLQYKSKEPKKHTLYLEPLYFVRKAG